MTKCHFTEWSPTLSSSVEDWFGEQPQELGEARKESERTLQEEGSERDLQLLATSRVLPSKKWGGGVGVGMKERN